MSLARTSRAALSLVALALVAGCSAGPRMFVNRDADMSFYKKVAVVPFSNLTSDNWAGERVTRAFVTELTIAGRFEIVDPGEFYTVLDKIGGLPDAQGHMEPQKLAEAAAQVGATGVIRGAVTEYQLQRSSTEETPVVTFDAEMVDVATKNVAWRVSVSKRGHGRVPVVGGSGSRTFGRVVQEACEEAVRALEQEAF